MKHIKLYQTNDEQMSDVLLNPNAPYPIVSYSKDNVKVGFCGNPVVNAEVMIPQTDDDDMPFILKSDMNIKSLTVDGELLWKKDTFTKHTYEISSDDFVEDKKGYVFYKAGMLNKINNCSKNIHITCDSEPFGIFMFAYETDYYGDTRANGMFLPLAELSTLLSIEKIGENKYDFTQAYLKLSNLEGVSVYFVLTDSNGNILQQTIEFECLEVYAGDEQTMDITKDNILTYANHGHVGKIVGDISADDYFVLIMWNEGQLAYIELGPISEFISFGMGELSDNELQFDITQFIGTGGLPSGISFSYGIANSLLDVDTFRDSGNEYLLNYVKDVKVKFKPTFNYLPILSQGNHVLKFELAQHKQFAPLTPNYLINVDMSKVDGHYINIVGTFAGATNLKGVRLPKHIEYIGRSAFYNCTSLNSIVIPSSVTAIDNYAFQGCKSLTTIVIPSSVTKIYDNAFSGCTSLTSVTIPSSVTSIDYGAFRKCTSLTYVTILDGVTSIGGCAFYGCTSLTSIEIPNSVTSIDSNAFEGTPFYNNLPNGEIYLGGCYYKYKGTMPINTSITIKDGTKSINYAAFSGCKGLTEVVIPNTVTSIGGSAFSGCDNLTEIIIPDSVTTIGNYAFRDCTSLSSVTIPDSVTSIGNDAFNNCNSLTSVTIGSGVTTIASWAFKNCTSLSSITIPSSVTKIYDNAFSGCSSLTSVTIPSGVTSIGNNAFGSCYFQHDKLINNSSASGYPWNATLCDIVQEDGLCISGTTAIKCRPNATTVTIPSSVTSISDKAFNGCTNLTSVTIPNSVTSIPSNAFGGYIFQRDKLVNNSSVSGYPWGATLYDIVQDDGLCISGTTAVKCKTNATNVTIPSNVKNVGNKAFSGCTNLASVTILDGVTSIGSSAFTNCTSLSSVTISDSVTNIGYCAFSGCTSLVSVNIPNNMSHIKAQVFEGCTSLTSIIIPSKVQIIDAIAFSGCTSLSSITCLRTLSTSVGAAFQNLPTNGKLYAPSGSDYSSWLSKLPSGWTIEYI